MDHINLLKAATDSIALNIEHSGKDRYLTAGRRQFRSLWTRDFLFASHGLELAGHAELRDAQLLLLLNRMREDGALPRSLDGFNTKVRVCLAPLLSAPLGQKLHAEYLGEHGTPAADSAPLLILEVLRSKNEQLIKALLSKLPLLLKDKKIPLTQPAFSDWQDSAARTGPTFYLNLLWWAAFQALEKSGLVENKAAPARQALLSFFTESLLPLDSLTDSRLSFDGTLLALRFGFFLGEQRGKLWNALREHPTWRLKPGVPVSAPYKKSEISWTTRLVGLRHYHDGLAWTWLLALALRFARELGDTEEEERLAGILGRSLKNGLLPEVLDPMKQFGAFRSTLYRSECPFSWGAGILAEALLADTENLWSL